MIGDKIKVAIFGAPRSGTSWTASIFDSAPEVVFKFQPLFSYAFKDRLQSRSTFDEIEQFFLELEMKSDNFMDRVDDKAAGLYPTFKKSEKSTHIVFKEARYLHIAATLLKNHPQVKIVLITRNPLDVMNSWINAPKEFKEHWNIQDEWQFGQSKNEYLAENYFGYNKWKEATKMFCDLKKQYDNRVYLVRYEDLNNNPLMVVKDMFSFCGIAMEKQTEQFIIDSQSKSVDDPNSVFRGNNRGGKKKNVLPDNIVDLINNDLKNFPEAKKLGYI